MLSKIDKNYIQNYFGDIFIKKKKKRLYQYKSPAKPLHNSKFQEITKSYKKSSINVNALI